MANNQADTQYWSMTEGVFNCLIDDVRTKAFAKAIKKIVRKGDVVVDMGTGSGILALIAAKTGAAKVYAVEIDKNNIKTLRNTFAANGYSDVIEVIEGSILDVSLPEKVDVIIGEMIATALIEELQAKAMNQMLKFAKKDVRVLLHKYDTYVDLVDNNTCYHGFDFDILRYEYPDEKELKSKPHTKKALVRHYDFSRPIKKFTVSEKIPLRITVGGIVNGIRLSGETTFSDKSKLGATFAYDYPLILPLTPFQAKKGEVYVVELKYTVCGGMDTLKYSLTKN